MRTASDIISSDSKNVYSIESNYARVRAINVSLTVLWIFRARPPCTLDDRIRKSTADLQNALRNLSTEVNTSSIPCKRMYPCEIPSVLSRQDMFRPPYETTKSLPTSSIKLSEYCQRHRAYSVDNNRSRECIAVQTKPSDVEEVLCSRVCSNTWVWIFYIFLGKPPNTFFLTKCISFGVVDGSWLGETHGTWLRLSSCLFRTNYAQLGHFTDSGMIIERRSFCLTLYV